MSLLLIGQIWLCLLATFTLGLLVGWLAKRLAASQKRTASLQNHGVVSHGREAASRERDITTIQLNDLRAQVEMATGALEKRETSLAKLETDLTERVAALSAVTVQNDQLQTRLRETETALQHNTQSAISLEAEVRTLRSELGTKDRAFHQFLLRAREHNPLHEKPEDEASHIAELTTHIHSLVLEKEETISQLQARVSTLEPLNEQLAECTNTLREAATYYQTEIQDKDTEIIRLQAHINTLQFSGLDSANAEAKIIESKTRHQTALREKEATIARLQARVAGLELLLRRKNERSTVPFQFSPSVHHSAPTSFSRESLVTRPRVTPTDLTEINGLNEGHVPTLREAGITNRAALLAKGLSAEGRSEIATKTGLSPTLILQWVRHADLLRLDGMSGIYAELLDAAGVDSLSALTKCTAETLHQKFLDVNATKRLSRILPILAQIRDWIDQAKQLAHPNVDLRLAVANQAP